jgi:hypothetical protein
VKKTLIIVLMLLISTVITYVTIQRNEKHEQTLFEANVCGGKKTSFTYLSDKSTTLTLLFGIDSSSFIKKDYIISKKYSFLIKQVMPDQTSKSQTLEINSLAGLGSLSDEKTTFSPRLNIAPLTSVTLSKGLNTFEIISSCDIDNLNNIRAYYAINDFHPKI